MSSHAYLQHGRRLRARALPLLTSIVLAGAGLALLAPAVPARAAEQTQASAVGNIIIDAAQVEAAVARGAIVWDVRAAEDYQRGHLPGAINVGDAGKVLRDEQKEDFLPTATIERIFSEAGLDPDKEIVVYGARGNPYAYFGGYAVRAFGGKNVRVFHDGFEGWQEAGKPVATTATRLPRVALTLKPVPSLASSTDEVLQAVARPGVQILDVRTRKEYAGEDIRAIRGGHIPGAINIPFEENWRDASAPQKIARQETKGTEGLALKSRPELEALYQALDRNKETIVYCQSGVRAAETSTVLESLGFSNVKVYDSSWLGWAAKLSAPVENETFLNVGLLTGQIGALKRQVGELERKLAAR